MRTVSIDNGPKPMVLPFLARERLVELAKDTLPLISTVAIQRFALRCTLRKPVEKPLTSIKICEERLYRGCREHGQAVLRESYLTTIAGVYLSLTKDSAKSYAVNGTGIPLRDELVAASPVLYTCTIENLGLLDLRIAKNEDIVFSGFASFLHNILESDSLSLLTSLDRNWTLEENRIISDESLFRDLVDSVRPPVSASELLCKTQRKLNGALAEYLASLGLDGIIDSDSNVLVFDPEKVRIIDEMPVSSRCRFLS